MDTSPEQALERLRAGNARFIAGRREHPYEFLTRAQETAEQGQRPIATILSCSDSRVPLEIIFDQGIGDIFVIRIMGNVCADSQLGSIEFSLRNIGVRLCVILGHTKCGAVTAACEGGMHEEKNVRSLLAAIKPAIDRAEAASGCEGKDVIDLCCRENVFVQIESLFRKSPILREAVKAGELMVLGGLYDIENGEVEFLGPHPDNNLLAENEE